MPENSGNSLPDYKLYRQYSAYKSIADRIVR